MREIELKPSRHMGLLLLGMTLLALVAIHLADVSAATAVGLGAVAAGLGGWGWRRTMPRGSLRLAADGRLQNWHGADEWRDIEVLDDSFVSPGLIVLRYRAADRRVRSLTLFSDSANADDLRQLRVSLRWAPRIRSGTASPDVG